MKTKLESDTGSNPPACCALRIPRRETEKWSRLAKCLDVIARQIDYPATHQGFCRRKVKVLDAALAEIIRSAQEARSIIQHNVEASHGEH